MISKATVKWIRSLENKKGRETTGQFLAEGHKVVSDLLPLLECQLLVATNAWLQTYKPRIKGEIIETDQATLDRISLLKNPQQVLAVFKQPNSLVSPEDVQGQLCLALDTIQDPGNLGTILRIADWFGIHYLICSPDTVDAYNPKVVQATMGAIGRVNVVYTPLETFLPATGLPIFGTFLEGTPIHQADLPAAGIVVLGNEGNGISKPIADLVQGKLYIPDYPAGQTGSESLNVAVATAIVCHEFRRRLQG
ncbi:MAG: RNA methyltransferase [Bacteroidales bacterium]|nr:RNA methyltransferase [Bacteroidales bacterium]